MAKIGTNAVMLKCHSTLVRLFRKERIKKNIEKFQSQTAADVWHRFRSVAALSYHYVIIIRKPYHPVTQRIRLCK